MSGKMFGFAFVFAFFHLFFPEFGKAPAARF